MDSVALGVVIVFVISIAGHWLKNRLWGEKPSKEPEQTVVASVISKEVRPGTHRSGRSNGGYSYVVYFATEEGKTLELYAYEVEFGALKEGTQGKLTYRDRYFVSFEEFIS